MSIIESGKEVINAGLELAKEHPAAAAAIGVTTAVVVSFGIYKVVKRPSKASKKESMPDTIEANATPCSDVTTVIAATAAATAAAIANGNNTPTA